MLNEKPGMYRTWPDFLLGVVQTLLVVAVFVVVPIGFLMLACGQRF